MVKDNGLAGCQHEECFIALFRDYFASMCIFAERYLNDMEAARDVVHDIYCKLWQNYAEMGAVEQPRNYLYVMVRNRCLDILRRRTLQSRHVRHALREPWDEELFFESEMLREDVYRLLDSAVRTLPERSREILLLKMQGLKNQEIADKLNISANTVNTLKTNAYKLLRKHLQGLRDE